MSTISCLSSFPETPRDPSFSVPVIESPTKPDRKNRACSQTVVSVKQVDLLRTAIGRTMSLQPSRQVVDALQLIADAEEAEGMRALDELIREKVAVPRLESSFPVSNPTRYDEEDADAALVEEDVEIDGKSYHPENGIKKVLFALDSPDPPSPTSNVTRSVSFPSKLLARHRSMSTSTPHTNSLPTRRSEVLSGGYFRRALRALRGEHPEARMSMPPLPSQCSRTKVDSETQT